MHSEDTRRERPDGYDFFAFGEVEKMADMLNDLGNGRMTIAMGPVYTGTRYHDCEGGREGGDCYCQQRYLGREERPSLRAPRVKVSPWSEETVDTSTPILRGIARFLHKVYGFHSNRERGDARFALAWAADAGAKRPVQMTEADIQALEPSVTV